MVDSEPAPAEREQDDDYDLLTYGEVGVRLQEEIAKEREKLAGLTSDAGDSTGAASAMQARIEALTDAAERYGQQRITNETFERFFGFPSRRRQQG